MVENAATGAAPSIVDRLAGKTILLTGVTGFLGQVIFERLLGDVPEGRIVLFVRSRRAHVARPCRVPVPQAGVRRVARPHRRRPAARAPGRAGHDRGRGLLARGPAAPGRYRCRDPLRRDRVVRPADRRGVPDEPVRRHEPVPRRDRQRLAPVSGAHLHGLCRRCREGRRPRGHARPQGGLADRGRAGAAGASRRRGAVPSARDARRLHGQGVERALARRSDDRGGGRRATPQGLGVETADALRPVTRAFARVARRLHVHEGDGRTSGRGARRPRGAAPVHRPAVDHRERAVPSRAGLDRRLQDGGSGSSVRTGWGRVPSSRVSRRASSTSSRSTWS